MKQILKFNTGRRYSSVGQPMFAFKEGEQILFWDAARDIYGEVAEGAMTAMTPSQLMFVYDNGDYTSNVASMWFRNGMLLEASDDKPQSDMVGWNIPMPRPARPTAWTEINAVEV
jgi:hypothetical protein